MYHKIMVVAHGKGAKAVTPPMVTASIIKSMKH